MRIVFMGSAALACPSLERLLTSALNVVGVVTQPDRPKGRDLRPAACPVRAHIGQREIPILTPINVNSPESIAQLRSWRPDLIVVVAYGQILKPALLAIPARGCLNVHASLLPRYRGAAPIQWAIARGETQTGVTTMFMDAGLDTGDILLQSVLDIDPEENTGELMGRLARLGADVLLRTLSGIADGAIAPIPQDNNLATSAPSLKRDAGAIDWSRPAAVIVNLIRGCTPRPGAFSRLDGSQVKVFKATLSDGSGEPGQILSADNNGIVVAAGEGSVRLLEVQPESRKRMSAADFARGGVKVGRRFDVRIN